jgi:hypothetical protein
MSRTTRILVAAAVLVCAAVAGYLAAVALSPERLKGHVEGWLARATHAPASVASLRLVVGFPVRLEGTGVLLWDGDLSVERASARIDVISLLLGHPRLTSLRLDGARLRLARTPKGKWSPPIFGGGDGEPVEPALAIPQAIAGATRSLLTRPLLADSLVVRRSRISITHPDPAGVAASTRFVLESVNGRLLHSRLFGDARLSVRVRLVQDGRERGRLEWAGSRGDDGEIEAALAATGLDLSTLDVYLRGAQMSASLRGTLDGVVDIASRERGAARLDLDLAVSDLETWSAAEAGAAGAVARAGPDGAAAPLRIPSLALRMGIDLDPERVAISRARIDTGELDFALDAAIARPLAESSQAALTVSLAELPLASDDAQQIAGWIPAASRARFVSLAERLRSGRLVRAELSGEARLASWRDLLAGRLERLPAGLRFALEVEQAAIDVDARNRLEALDVSLELQDDRLRVQRARGDLNGGPLPEIEVSFQGVSKLLASTPEERESSSSAEALLGLTPLFEYLRGGDDAQREPAVAPPSIALTFERLDHPALLWPLHDVRVQLQLERDADGVRIAVDRCAWAGVFLDGEVDWTLHPARRVSVDLVASDTPPESGVRIVSDDGLGERAPAPAGEGEPWVVGRFEVGPYASPRWSQRGARGRFSAAGGELRLAGVDIDLTPSGRLSGWANLDLTLPDAVPWEAQVALAQGDVKTLIAQRGAEGEVATGTLGVDARLSGTIVPGRTLLHDASGTARLDAVDGAIARSVPPVFALALASSSLNPFTGRDELRYSHGTGSLELERGVLRTSDLEIEGPDVRMFASGSLDLSQSPPPLDAEIVLFLFRQFDRALELIPILNVLLLGDNQNLVAAYFELTGTWSEPVASPKPLRTLEEGPTEVLTRGIPRVMKRGMDAIGGLFRGGAAEPAPEGGGLEPPAEAGS